MAQNDNLSNLRLLRGFFAEFLAVLRKESRPQHMVVDYHRACLGLLGLYPNKKLASNLAYRLWNWFILINISILLTTIACSIHGSQNIIDMGDDLVWSIGVWMILTKMRFLHLRANEIDDVIKDFDYYKKQFRHRKSDEQLLYWERLTYLVQGFIFINCFVLLNLFGLAIIAVPFISDQDLPFHATYPFDWHSPSKHPWVYRIIYIGQCITSQHNLMSILTIDLLGIHIFVQTALNVQILCIEMRNLGNLNCSDEVFHQELIRVIKFHQHIIGIVKKINSVLYGSFIIQIIASFGLISLSTFEAIAAAGDPHIAAKFLLFMLVTFIQLSYWCLAGTLVYSLSLEVAQAAFDMNDWHTKSKMIQRDIVFVIQRAQKPLIFVAQPFMPFTLGTYTTILSLCYRILTLLRDSI